MKKLFAILLLILFSSCSFDNKTGIWNNTNTSKVKFDKYKDFKKLYSDKESFKEIINPPKNLKVLLSAAKVIIVGMMNFIRSLIIFITLITKILTN